MNQELIANCNQEVEEQLLVRRETGFTNSSSSIFFDKPGDTTDRFLLLHLPNRPPCTSSTSHGYSTTSTSSSFSGSLKRPSENPSTHQPKTKKPNNNEDNGNSLSGFVKIPLSCLSPEAETSLRRCISDPYSPPIAPLAEKNPHSPTPNMKIQFPGTPLSNAIASAKLPPRPPTLKRSVSDPIPSQAKTFSSSYGSPNPEVSFSSFDL